MVCDGPDPPENNPHEIVPPPRNELIMNGNQGDDSDEEHEYFGYEPLAQGPELAVSDHDSDDDPEVHFYLLYLKVKILQIRQYFTSNFVKD